MKTQKEINDSWLFEYQSNGLTMTVLQPPVRSVPGLRKPYQYEVGDEAIESLLKSLRSTLEPYDERTLQCRLVSFKRIAYGVRLTVFLLGYRPGFCGTPDGITEDQWNDCTSKLKQGLERVLGEDVPVYIEPWRSDAKFQARFETYIKRR